MNSKIQSKYPIGVLLVVTSAITFSSAGLFTKGVDAGAWEVIFWRGLFAAVFTCIWINRTGALQHNSFGMGYADLAVAVIGALGTAAFISAFKLTSIANVSLIYAGTPLLAALLSWLFIGEKVSHQTLIGSVTAVCGVLVIVSGSLGRVNLYGDFLALCMTTSMAMIMVIYRKYPSTPGAGPAVLSSMLLLPVAWTLGDPVEVEQTEIVVLAAFGLFFALASVTLAEGAKLLPSGKTALLSSLETPLAPVLAFMLLREIPNTATLFGGLIVLIAVLFSIVRD